MSIAHLPGLPPGRWGAVPATWVTHPDLGLDEIGVLACLATYADAEGWCWPKQGTIAEHLKRSRPWVIKVINRLVELGFLDRVQQYGRDGGQRPCRYRLRFERPVDRDARPECPRGDTPCSAPCPTDDSPRHGRDSEHPESEHRESLSPGAKEPARLPAREPAKAVVPPDWQPSREDLAWAGIHFPDVDLSRFTQQFVNSCHANGYRYHDHGRAWRSWLADSPKRRSTHGAVTPVTRRSGPPSRTGDLAERNRQTAGDARRRLLERRAGGLSAGGPAA